jgi:alpha-glucosidase
VIRHVTRWAAFGPQDDVARLAAAMLLSFEGAVCLYQGEELGQTETDIEFHELTDPPGITFWPDYKGRDGCRTPMVWDGSATGGFTTGTPWLPVKPPQRARNMAAQAGVAGSVLETYRALLAWRRGSTALRHGRTRFFDTPEPVLAFLRDAGSEAVACVFNLSDQPVRVAAHGVALGPMAQAARLAEGKLELGANGFAWLACPAGAAQVRIG